MAYAWHKAVWWFLATKCFLRVSLAFSSVPNVPFQNASFTNGTTRSTEPSSESTISTSSTSNHATEQSAASTSSQKWGDFIAQGLGMSATTDTSSTGIYNATTSLGSSYSTSALTSHSPIQVTGGSISSGSRENTSSPSGHSAPPASNGTLPHTLSINGTASPTGYIPNDEGDAPIWLNRSLTLSGDCWNQWSQFWSAQDWPTQRWTSHSESTVTFTTTELAVSMWTSTYFSFYTTTVFGGRFPLTTYTTLGPMKEYEWSTGSPTTTWTATRTYDPGYTVIEGPSISLPTPSCVLPGTMSQCQQSWDAWVDWQTGGQSLATFDPFTGPPGCDPRATTTIPWSCKAPISTWEAERSSYYANDNVPRCSQAKLNEDYCSSTRSLFLWRGEKKGYYFDDAQYTATTMEGVSTDVLVWPSETTLVGPGCTLGCGNCALQGQTVELIYWPPATALPNNTANHTATRVSEGPVTFETMGTTLTSPTVYISFDTLWAKNSCSRFGRSVSNTIVAITNTQDMSSLYGYGLHMDGRQMSASFNFNDLYQDPVPQEIYESQPRCWLSSRAAQGGRYRPLPSDYPGCARTAPYEPIIVIPAEVRELDPEWASCKGGIEGVYDPPVALRQTNAIVVPTQPGIDTTTSPAAPASTPISDSAPQTTPDPASSPQPTSAPKLPDHNTAVDEPPASPADPPAKPSNTAKENGNNVWPLPITDLDDDPVTTNALSVLKSAQESAAAAQVASQIAAGIDGAHETGASGNHASSEQEENNQAGSGWSGGTPSAQDPSHPNNQDKSGQPGAEGSDGSHADGTHAEEGSVDPGSHAADAAADPKQAAAAAAVWTYDGESYTAVVDGSSAAVYGAGTATTIAAGSRETFHGQDINVPPSGKTIKVDDNVLKLEPINAAAKDAGTDQRSPMVFTASGKVFTAVMQGGSMVLQAGGAATTMAPGAVGVFAGQTISVPSSAGNVVDVNGNLITMQALASGGTSASPASSVVWTHGSQTFTARMQGDSSILLERQGTTLSLTMGSTITVGSEVITVLPTRGVVIHDGTTVTLSHVPATKDPLRSVTTLEYAGETISAFDSGSSVVLVVGGKTLTIADGAQTTLGNDVFSAAATGGAVLVNGTATLTLHSTAAATHSAVATSAQATDESTGAPTDLSSDSPADTLLVPTATVIAILGFMCIFWL